MYVGKAGPDENPCSKKTPGAFLTWRGFWRHGPEGVRAGKARIIPVSETYISLKD